MAEAIGLAASIIQIAETGAKLSIALYNFTTSAIRANQDIRDIADDVELTSNALQSVGKVFEMEEAKSIISKQALRDANNIIQKCESVFNEISQIVEKRRTIGKDGKKSLSLMGKLAFPLKEQKIQLHRTRLESLKNSLVLLLHVLQLAQGQARGKMEKSAVEGEREKIRELHQLHQDSLKSLQALESKLCNVALDEEETLQGSATISRIPTMDLMTAVRTPSLLPPAKRDIHATSKTFAIESLPTGDSDTSENDATSSDDDENVLSLEALSRCAKHVQTLLKRINLLQNSFDSEQKIISSRKKHVHEMYRQFCRDFESTIVVEYKCFYVPCTYSSKSEAKCKRHMEKQHGWEDARSGSNEIKGTSAHNMVQRERPPRPTIIVPSPQQTDLQSSPLPQPRPLHASAKHSIFTPIDDSQSMLAAHWGSSNVNPPRNEASPLEQENRSPSIDTAAMSCSQQNGHSPPQPHQAQMANQCSPVSPFWPELVGFSEGYRRDDTPTNWFHYTYTPGHSPVEPTHFENSATPGDDTINHNDTTNNDIYDFTDMSAQYHEYTTSSSTAVDSAPPPPTTTGSTTAASIPHFSPPAQTDHTLFSPQMYYDDGGYNTPFGFDADTAWQADVAFDLGENTVLESASSIPTAPQEQAKSNKWRTNECATAFFDTATHAKRTPGKRARDIDNEENSEPGAKKAKTEEIMEGDVALKIDDGATGRDGKDIVDVLLGQWTVSCH